jgi:hypothetical protein
MQNENLKNDTPFVRLELTTDQKAQVHKSVGREADAIELSAQELEERIAPRINLRAE